MIVKVKCGKEWTYIADVDEVKLYETKEENMGVDKMFVFRDGKPLMEIGLRDKIAYLMNNEGKTIDRIN